jgi:hypothetical protein
MRAVVGMAVMISVVSAAHVAASEPDPPSSEVPQSSQGMSSAPTASPPSEPAPSAKPEEKTSAAADAAHTSDTLKTELTPDEKNLLRQGYKLEVRSGVKYFCRTEGTLGSRLHDHKVCGTEEAILGRNKRNQDDVRDSLKPSAINGH